MRKILLISPNVSDEMGGEAIKAFQFARYLRAQGVPFQIVCHERSRHAVDREFAPDEVHYVRDDWLHRLLWRTVVLRMALSLLFNIAAARHVRRAHAPGDVLLHYIAPVSPVVVRLPPRGYDFVIGPMTGNIYYPPGFRHRMSRKDRIRERLHGALQRFAALAFSERRRARALLVSGYDRTRASLRLAGAPEASLVDVVDAGVSDALSARPRLRHSGRNPRFFCSGRMVDHKGIDLAIRAVAKTADITLDISGDGEKRAGLEALARRLGVTDRVRFLGWLDYDDLLAGFANYRGYVFPSLAEANGIVMQEAMMIGLPVITLRWGGPAMLADDASAEYIDPVDEEQVAAEIALRMERLAEDAKRAEALSVAARRRAEERFVWDKVAASWMAVYP